MSLSTGQTVRGSERERERENERERETCVNYFVHMLQVIKKICPFSQETRWFSNLAAT